jgi:hypothetical protein
MEIKAVKSAFGWKAENYFPIDSETRITITTMKRYSGQLTTTVVGSRKEGGMWYYTVCQDYGMTWAANSCSRVTKPAVEAQQAEVIAKLWQIENEVVAFYLQLRETT